MKRVMVAIATIVMLGCEQAPDADSQVRDYSEIFTELPQEPVYPKTNAFSLVKEQLGELLFWDPILSGGRNVSCASCHHPDFGWADGRSFSIGSDGIGSGPDRYGQQVTPIHSPTIMNNAFTGLTNDVEISDFVAQGYFWDLRVKTLEEQSLGPIKNPVEMLGYNYTEDNILAEIVYRLENIARYVDLFEQAFSVREITADKIAQAIATFERKIISPNSRFDRFMAGDRSVFSDDEIAGLNKFIDVGCARCHSGPMLSDNIIHIDEPVISDQAAVRTPSLRNISQTAPYMHDGSQNTLRDAIAFYADRNDLQLTMDEDDVAMIEAFLMTLDTSDFYRSKPNSVPSGLPVGGD